MTTDIRRTNGRPDIIEIAVRFVASQTDGAARILSVHRRRADGCCAGCATTPVRWPCTAATIATAATKNGQGTT